jgi:hypothetical protein
MALDSLPLPFLLQLVYSPILSLIQVLVHGYFHLKTSSGPSQTCCHNMIHLLRFFPKVASRWVLFLVHNLLGFLP